MHVESGEGWSAMRADAVETEYRRFLFLMKKYPDAGASPSVDVDTFWHYHILDTMKYARDCEAAFGYFLHHYPYVGIGEGADEGDHESGGERMRAIYEAEFGAAAGAQAAWCTSPGKPEAASAWCTSPGKPLDAAWCTSPGKPVAASAWCTSPGKPLDAAWCTSPGKQMQGSAWCTSPGRKVDSAAWCTSPGKPRDAANAATAWCTSPGKPVASECAATGKDVAHAA
ncbi:glycine-rich domain-containing protein [Massilia yuzhufengensis]|nr:glycine-rich domain-containing protein-like [Massilia yuzhufengensis]